MSLTTGTIRRTIQREQAQVETCARQVGLTVDEYRAVRFLFRGAGIAIAAAALFAPGVRSDPIPTLTIIASFVLGPDVVEAYLMRGE